MAITILLVYYCKIHLGLKISRAYHLQALFGITSTLLYLAAQMSWDSVELADFATGSTIMSGISITARPSVSGSADIRL